MNKPTMCTLAILSLAIGSPGAGKGDDRFMEFPNSLPGKLLKVRKELDPSSGRMVLVSNLPEVGQISDLLNLEKNEGIARRQVHGNLDEILAAEMEELDLLATCKVWIRVKSENVAPLDKTLHSEEVLRQNARDMLDAPLAVSPALVLARYLLVPTEVGGDGMVLVTASKLKLLAMKNDPDIAAIWKDRKEETLSPELPTLAASAYMGSVPSGAGSGVKSATFEDGITSTFLSCLGISATYDNSSGDAEAKRHAESSFRCLVSAAPSATFYHRRSGTFNGTNDVNYIVNNGIQTLSMSFTRGGTSPYSATYSEFLTMDNMAYTYPYPVFVNPAANGGYSYGVNWQGYNAISVGNVRHTNSSTFEMAECTQTKNPPPRYGSCISGSGGDCAGDREMPHIVVPGIPSSGSTFGTSCIGGSGSISCGTSWSAPIGNGVAAAVIGADSRLVSWPEKVRATLILTAQNVENGGWTISEDERDGTGTIAGSDAIAFAQGHTSVSPGNTACEKGMGATSFYASDFGSNKRYNYLVPNPKPSGKHLRVVLTWDSNPNVSNGTNDMSDLDLVVQKNGGTQSSASWDSNVEVVDIPAGDLTAGSSYYIDISPYANRIPSGSYFYYAIAWVWVADEAP